MRQPMQVDAHGFGFQARQKVGYVETPAIHHAQRQIDDPDLHAAIVQVARYRQESERIHFEHGGGGHHVAHRTVEDRFFAKVVNAGRMQQQQVHPRTRFSEQRSAYWTRTRISSSPSGSTTWTAQARHGSKL